MNDLIIKFKVESRVKGRVDGKILAVFNSTALYRELSEVILPMDVFGDKEGLVKNTWYQLTKENLNEMCHVVSLVRSNNSVNLFATTDKNDQDEPFTKNNDHYNKDLYVRNLVEIDGVFNHIWRFLNQKKSFTDNIKDLINCKDKIEVSVSY